MKKLDCKGALVMGRGQKDESKDYDITKVKERKYFKNEDMGMCIECG